MISIGCNGQANTQLSKDSIGNKGENTKTALLGPLTKNFKMEDPYFVESKDTLIAYGPNCITRNVLQDKKGNYWLATWEGIVGYDGNYFTNYTLKARLRHFHVFTILEDKAGNLWFGTIRGGVYRYDGKNFRLFTSSDGLLNDMIQCMFEDNTGNIWFGTDEGVSCFDGKNFINFTTQDGLSGRSVNSIVQDKTGKLWFGTRYGKFNDVCFYDPSAKPGKGEKLFSDFKGKEGARFSNVRSILEDETGNIWIGGQDGLFRYTSSLNDSLGAKKTLIQISPNFIGYIFEDKAGNLWLSKGEETGMALYRYDGVHSVKMMASRQVFGITEDKSGKIWFGTMNGVCSYDPSAEMKTGGKAFTTFTEP